MTSRITRFLIGDVRRLGVASGESVTLRLPASYQRDPHPRLDSGSTCTPSPRRRDNVQPLPPRDGVLNVVELEDARSSHGL